MTAAQVVLRRHLQHGLSLIPKSSRPKRIAENATIFDFDLSNDQMSEIDALDTGTSGGPRPDEMTGV